MEGIIARVDGLPGDVAWIALVAKPWWSVVVTDLSSSWEGNQNQDRLAPG